MTVPPDTLYSAWDETWTPFTLSSIFSGDSTILKNVSKNIEEKAWVELFFGYIPNADGIYLMIQMNGFI